MPEAWNVALPMTSAPSAYSVSVHDVDSGTRVAPDVHTRQLACPRPRLWPNSCAVTSTKGNPLTQISPPSSVARPANGQSSRSGKYTSTC